MQGLDLAIDGLFNIDIIIKNTKIGNGFAYTLLVNSVKFIDCTIDLSTLSGDGVISANHVSFVNCKFIGELSKERRFNPVLEYSYQSSQDTRMNDYNVEFIDCEFGLSENWKNSLYSNGKISDDPGKQFIVIKTEFGMSILKGVNILFRRCYYSEGGFNGNLRLVKSVAENEKNRKVVSIVGDDSGISVDWCFVENENSLDYGVGDWSNIISNTGYYPNINQESISESPSINIDDINNPPKDNNSNKSKTWMIVAIVFIVACVILVVVLVIILVFRKKSFDRSENEN